MRIRTHCCSARACMRSTGRRSGRCGRSAGAIRIGRNWRSATAWNRRWSKRCSIRRDDFGYRMPGGRAHRPSLHPATDEERSGRLATAGGRREIRRRGRPAIGPTRVLVRSRRQSGHRARMPLVRKACRVRREPPTGPGGTGGQAAEAAPRVPQAVPVPRSAVPAQVAVAHDLAVAREPPAASDPAVVHVLALVRKPGTSLANARPGRTPGATDRGSRAPVRRDRTSQACVTIAATSRAATPARAFAAVASDGRSLMHGRRSLVRRSTRRWRTSSAPPSPGPASSRATSQPRGSPHATRRPRRRARRRRAMTPGTRQRPRRRRRRHRPRRPHPTRPAANRTLRTGLPARRRPERAVRVAARTDRAHPATRIRRLAGARR